MYLKILIPIIFAVVTYIYKKLSVSAIILALILGEIIIIYGGYNAFIALAITFILTILSDKLKKRNKDKKRNILQIICNVLTPALCIVLYKFSNNNIYYTMYYCVLASSLADTLASGIGSLSKKDPVNIFTMKRQEKGSSGGISALGTFASLIGGLILGIIYFLNVQDLSSLLLITVLGLIGSLIDSILGIVFQAVYKCPVCKKQIENKAHCNQKSKLIKGYPFMDNNMVNLLNNVIIFIFSYLLLI